MSAQSFIENLHGEDAFQGFAVSQPLYSGRSDFQSIEIFETLRFGRALVLDGIVQTTERDEFMYHEMLVHVPLFSVDAPQRVLIVGGGDGGSLREVLKHDIESVDMVEIDKEVVERCIEFLPSLNNAGAIYSDARSNLIVNDAFDFLPLRADYYDVIISDSTDPIGAGAVLFSSDFYRLCKQALKPGGAMSFQNGVAFLQPEEPRDTIRKLQELDLMATCYLTSVPTYYGGPMTLAYAAKNPAVFAPPISKIRERFNKKSWDLRHYTPEHHQASFVLPKWISELIGERASDES